MQISVLKFKISVLYDKKRYTYKIGIAVFQKEITLSKMDISVLQIDISI